MQQNNKLNLLAFLLVLFLVCCARDGGHDFSDIISEDYENLYAHDVPSNITLEQAISMALESNLDAQIAQRDYVVSLSDAQLQKLNALPTITAKREFITRSNDGASSSISAQTGVQSLEPSISTDKSRWTSTLEANWDVLDSAISLYRSKSAVDRAVIAEERYRKVRQNVIMDTYSAFWRLASLQMLSAHSEDLLEQSQQLLDELETVKSSGDVPYGEILSRQQEILSKRKRLLALDREEAFAALELKALLSISPESELSLKYDPKLFANRRVLKAHHDANEYVKTALLKRPEIREEVLNLKISERNLNAEILQTFPGLNILVTGNQDENSFLDDNQWISLTAGITQSITRLLTLPARYDKAEKEIELANSRRKALVAAVVSQVNISNVAYIEANKALLEEKKSFDLSRIDRTQNEILRENGLLSGMADMNNRLEHEISRIDFYQRVTDLHVAYARLMNSIGYDLEDYFGLKIDDPSVQERGYL